MAELLKHVSLSDKRRTVLDPETNALRDGLSLKEKAYASQKGSADVESVEEWMSSVLRGFCVLETDQASEFDVGARPMLVHSGVDVVVCITREDKFLDAQLRVHDVLVKRVVIVV